MEQIRASGVDWLEIWFPFKCQLHWCYPSYRLDTDSYQVFLHHSEPSFAMLDCKTLREHHKAFDLILTNNEALLDLENTKFMLFGDSWVNSIPNNKEMSVSFLYSLGPGRPDYFTGYNLRTEIWNRRQEISIPKRYWTGTRRPLPEGTELNPLPSDKKDPLFESLFSIVIENSCERNYFTEKIIDAFLTYTVPIYIGCINIGDYFDNRGIIVCSSVNEIIDKSNALTVDLYQDMIPYVQNNFLLAQQYVDWRARVRTIVLEARKRKT
jgi:hypothetical protein